MPFTAAHPAAVLPLRRLRCFDWTALVIGTTLPDWEYFLQLRHVSLVSHTPLGLLSFCLPVGLVIWVLFEALVQRPLILVLPRPWRERLWKHRTRGWPTPSRWLRVALSLVIGAGTHVAWDSITEPGNWLIDLVPVLDRELLSIGGAPLPAYRMFQHLGTAFGLAVLGIFVLRWYRRETPEPAPELSRAGRWSARTALVLLPLAVGGFGAIATNEMPHHVLELWGVIVDGVIVSIAVAAGTLLAIGVIWRLWGRASERAEG